ncbi:MAG: PKD domain-containing protein [Planctomycetota bacterium]|nr:PKD domain-containing protein [Planctomycetota bacterium]
MKVNILRQRWFQFCLASLAIAAAHTFTDAETFGERLNPTGYPIGGGPEYVNIINRDAADIVVSTKDELVEAIKKAKKGNIIYVRDDAEIDMTGADDQAIPPGVTLASGRGNNGSLGGLVFSNSLTDERLFMPLFRTGGKGVRITGLRIRGPFGEAGDHHMDQIKIANGIKADHEDLEVDNCEMWAWNKWSIDLAIAGGAYIHHNYIHHTRRWGYGYGVWVRGGGKSIIEANLFDFCRHHIGSGSQATSSYEARYNICLYHDLQPSFDRHGNQTKAGHDTHIHHNEFRNPQFAGILFRGNPLGRGHFHDNWFAHASRKSAFINRAKTLDRVTFENNSYGGDSTRYHPNAVAVATPSAGTAPLTVQFDGTQSKDREGGRMIRYRWKFGDGKGPVGAIAETAKATHTFVDPGLYRVALYASNERGIPGVTWIPVEVKPSGNAYVLSAWLKDSYYGPLKGFYRVQMLIDGNVVWEDDVAGDEGGWQHLVMDVGKWVEGKEAVDLAFRLQADKAVTEPRKQVIACFLYVDDVHLFGGSLKGGDFESARGWNYREEPVSKFHGGVWSGEARSGKYAYRLAIFGYLGKVPAGALCEIKQSVPIGPKPKGKGD